MPEVIAIDRTTEQVETEVTLDAGLGTDLPDLADLVRPGRRRVHDLVATYLDTPRMDLQRHGMSLRRRTGGTDAGWHLKLPREGDSRTEHHAPLGSSTTRVPTALREIISDAVVRQPLLPVVTLRTRRVERPLHDPAKGTPARALLVDDLVVAAPGGAGWREVEVELTEHGDEALLGRVVAAIEGAGWRRSTSPSKYARAVDLLPDPSTRPLSPDSTAAEVVLAYVRAQVGVIQAREAGVREHDPGAVHRTRVATRRLRTTLRVFRRLFHRGRTDPLRDELRWYSGVLGAVRDLDVVRGHLLEEVDHLPAKDRAAARERITTTLDAAREDACADLDEVLDSARLGAIADGLVALAVDPPWRGRATRPAATVLPDLVDAAVERVGRKRAAARAAQDQDTRLALAHETRKKAKAARYAHEALALAWGKPAKKSAKRWKKVTEDLGSAQDVVTAREWLARIAETAREAGEDTGPFDLLTERAEQQARAAVAAGDDALRALST